eukprot:scaffold328569_cov66-Tisochrysis_lutea.AAC.1
MHLGRVHALDSASGLGANQAIIQDTRGVPDAGEMGVVNGHDAAEHGARVDQLGSVALDGAEVARRDPHELLALSGGNLAASSSKHDRSRAIGAEPLAREQAEATGTAGE